MTPEAYNAQILATLLGIQTDVAAIKAQLANGGGHALPSGNGAASGSRGGSAASDHDLDSEYGNPTIEYDPSAKYWGGESFKGHRFSECPAEYLEAQAKWLDATAYMKRKNPKDDKDLKSADYKAKDAARARGWAQRVRNGVTPAPAPQQSFGDVGDDSDIPF